MSAGEGAAQSGVAGLARSRVPRSRAVSNPDNKVAVDSFRASEGGGSRAGRWATAPGAQSGLRGRHCETRTQRALPMRPGRSAHIWRPPVEVPAPGARASRKPRPAVRGLPAPPLESQGRLARHFGVFGGVETGSLAVSRRWRWWGLQTRRQGPCALVAARSWEVGSNADESQIRLPRDSFKTRRRI